MRGILIFELSMGTLHVYFPDEEKWSASVPDWAKEKWQVYLDACTDWCKENRIPISIVNLTITYTRLKRIPDMKTIESERLFLRPLTLEDAELILQLLNTDGFIKYIGEQERKNDRTGK